MSRPAWRARLPAWRARLRRVAARAVVRWPAYPVATRLPATALPAARAAFRTGRDRQLAATLDRLCPGTRPDGPEAGAAPELVLRSDLRRFQGRYAEALADAEAVSSTAAGAARAVTLGYRVREPEAADAAAVAAVARFPLATEVLWAVATACRTPEQYRRLAQAWRDADTGPDGVTRVARQLAVAASRAGELEAAAGWYLTAIDRLRQAPGTSYRPATTVLAGLGAGRALDDLCRALDGAGVPFFFAAGTALGLVREGRLLGADNDIDVGVRDRDWDRDALVALFTADPRFDLDLHPQSQKVGLRHRGGSPVDIFRFYPEGDRVWHDGVFVRWHNSPFEVHRVPVGRRRLPLPAPADRYLTENYGDWRTPFPGFDAFTGDAPNLAVTWPEYQRIHLLRRAYEKLAAGDRAGADRELARAGQPAQARKADSG